MALWHNLLSARKVETAHRGPPRRALAVVALGAQDALRDAPAAITSTASRTCCSSSPVSTATSPRWRRRRR